MESRWRLAANEVLVPLYAGGRTPSAKELQDAYPFTMRKYTPYKIWLEQVRWFMEGCPDKPRGKPVKPLDGQEAML